MKNESNSVGPSVESGTAAFNSDLETASSACRTMAWRIDVLCDGTAHSKEEFTAEKRRRKDNHANSNMDLEICTENRTQQGAFKREAPTNERNVGLCPSTKTDGVENAIEGSNRLTNLRPSQVVRLLNSTPLGMVISERQLYRHRERAVQIENGNRKINLIAYCAWMHLRRHSPALRKQPRLNGRDVATLDELRQLLVRQDYKCALTGTPITPWDFELDHIIPIKDGGDFSAENSQLVLKSANRAKGTLSQKSFIRLCKMVSRHHRRSSKMSHEG